MEGGREHFNCSTMIGGFMYRHLAYAGREGGQFRRTSDFFGVKDYDNQSIICSYLYFARLCKPCMLFLLLRADRQE